MGSILPLALTALGVVLLLIVALLRRSTTRASVAATQTSEDLLEQAEEASFLAATPVPKTPGQTETAAAADGETNAESTPETGMIDWEERDDVYRPETVEAPRFVQSLRLERPPQLEPGHPYLFIRQSAYAQLREHLRQDLTVELGGLLYGQAFHDPTLAIYLLMIEAALPASDGIETATSFAYTPASWQGLTPRLQQLDAAWTLIGSYHSHPALGVFLSETDLSTQEAIFAQDWQLALVVDPVADELGFFVGKEGAPCPDWRILPDQAEIS
jgi:proteasome lid subunit RPN8/RPN11